MPTDFDTPLPPNRFRRKPASERRRPVDDDVMPDVSISPALAVPTFGLAVPPDVARRESLYRRWLTTADALAVVAALLMSTVVLGEDRPMPAALITLPCIVLMAKAAGLYDRDGLVVGRSTINELPRLFRLSTLATLLIALGQSVLIDGPLGGDQIGGMWLSLLGFLFTFRYVARKVVPRMAPAERCVVVGDHDVLVHLRGKVPQDGSVLLVESVPLERVIHDMAELRRIAVEHQAHRLIIAPSTASHHEDTMNLIRGAKSTGLAVSIVPGILEVLGAAVVFDELPGATLLGVRRFGLTRSSRALKRGFDLAGAGVAVLCFGPLMLVIATAIRLSSPGPVLFRQLRVGRDGRTFEILKFRSMVDKADAMRASLASRNEADGLFKIADDPRITRVGRVLRKTSLDELPQLLNILRGEMSLVGPRPLVVYEDARVTGFARRRLLLTPGMTGPWQIAGSARLPLAEMVKLDYLYVAGWTLWMDVKIVLRTVPYMLGRRGQ